MISEHRSTKKNLVVFFELWLSPIVNNVPRNGIASIEKWWLALPNRTMIHTPCQNLCKSGKYMQQCWLTFPSRSAAACGSKGIWGVETGSRTYLYYIFWLFSWQLLVFRSHRFLGMAALEVVSDFDTFLVGSMGMEYSPLPKDQQEPILWKKEVLSMSENWEAKISWCVFQDVDVPSFLGWCSKNRWSLTNSLTNMFNWLTTTNLLFYFIFRFSIMFSPWRIWCSGVWTTRPISSECLNNASRGRAVGWRC